MHLNWAPEAARGDGVPSRVRFTGGTTALTVPPTLAAPLSRVEGRLREVADGADGRLAEIGLHLIEAGGKRVRPVLVLASALAAEGVNAISDSVVDAAAAVELLHIATLYHDDVLDSAPTRRGRQSANALWGNHHAVLGGDVLLSHAYGVAADLGPIPLRRFCRTLTEVCAGQIAETQALFDPRRTPAHYETSIRGKTAALLGASCWLGAIAAGARADVADALGDFGIEIGVAFQVIDDVLDLCADARLIGKPAGSDLREGVYTLPLLLALGDDSALAGLLGEELSDEDIDAVARRVQELGADRRAIAVALDHLRAAGDRLADHPLHSEGTDHLAALTEAVVAPLRRAGLIEARAA